MDSDDIRIGRTYRVHLPRRDEVAQQLSCDPRDTEADLTLLSWMFSGAEDFDLTVTAIDAETITGIRVSESSQISTPLPPAHAERLGLSTEVEYLVQGVLVDASTGKIVTLPADQVISVPAHWLLTPSAQD
jgi:hypothetical protein